MSGLFCYGREGQPAVLLELFTSEGCSSCPPADQLLAKLDRFQPIKDVQLIVLSEHVDYWNHGGWIDPYSSSSFSERQQHYAAQLHTDDIYTPQLVVDGHAQLVGSDWAKAKSAIETARRSPKLTINLGIRERRSLLLSVNADALLPDGDVYLALAEDTAELPVKAGENSGRHLSHTAVVYSLAKVGKVSSGSAFARSIALPGHSKWGGSTRVIAFVQDPRSGRILGASQQPMPQQTEDEERSRK